MTHSPLWTTLWFRVLVPTPLFFCMQARAELMSTKKCLSTYTEPVGSFWPSCVAHRRPPTWLLGIWDKNCTEPLKSPRTCQATVARVCNPSTRRQNSEFENSLVYRTSSQTVGVTQRNPVSKTLNPNKQKFKIWPHRLDDWLIEIDSQTELYVIWHKICSSLVEVPKPKNTSSERELYLPKRMLEIEEAHKSLF